MITTLVSRSGWGVEEFDPAKVRRAVFQAQSLISSGEQIPVPIEHLFLPGLYCRKVFIPKDSVNTGKIHRHNDMLTIASGKVTFYSEDGRRTLDASDGPVMVIVHAGVPPVVYAHEDTWMVSAHANPDNLTDPEEMERQLIIPNEFGQDPEVLK